MFMSDWSAFMTPQKATLDSMCTLLWLVSYRRLLPQFKFSLSAAALGIYLYGHMNPILCTGPVQKGGNPSVTQIEYCKLITEEKNIQKALLTPPFQILALAQT